MRFLANCINELGRLCDNRSWFSAANRLYGLASQVSPEWAVPWFNLGLNAKYGGKWAESQKYNERAAALDPRMEPAWWNLGIAATINQDWPTARRAWQSYGITIPQGDGPLEMDLGSVPIRINPKTSGEVVWCQRIDPARARIFSVPFPESGHRYGDLLLTDGAPKGYRITLGKQVPVFDELAVILASDWQTFGVELTAPGPADSQDLVELAQARGLVAEDWSDVEVLCKACSEGIPHEHEPFAPKDNWNPQRKFGIAAHENREVEGLLNAWQEMKSGRAFSAYRRLGTQ